MTQVSFYHQKRNDGGLRSGITVDDVPAWMHYEEGAGGDPALLWYVDVTLSVKAFDGGPMAARDIFLKHADTIQKALGEIVDTLHSENGTVVWPVSASELKVEPGIQMTVRCSAIRRLRALDLAAEVGDLQVNWPQHIQRLTAFPPAKKAM